MTMEKAKLLVERHFRNIAQRDPKIRNAYLLIHSDTHGVHWNLAEGRTGDTPADPRQPLFIASIGKLFTAVLMAMLAQGGQVSFDDKITKYLDSDLLQGLHVYGGKDYTPEIRISHLLNHTSGLHDYFSDKPKHGKPFIKIIFDESNRFWTPREIITWSKNNLVPHFPPGKGFHYSDTGYHVLGLIIEKVLGMPWHDALKTHIFEPLEMKHTFCPHWSEPLEKSDLPVARVFSDGTDVTEFRSLSCDYAGGGIAAPAEDLLKFMQALTHHTLIKAETFDKMKDWARFSIGINYGYGMMSIVTVPLIMPERYNCWGNAGSIGSFMFYHPRLKTYFIGSLNQFGYAPKGIRFMMKCIGLVANGLRA